MPATSEPRSEFRGIWIGNLRLKDDGGERTAECGPGTKPETATTQF